MTLPNLTAAAYDEIAPRYDDVYKTPVAAAEDKVVRQALAPLVERAWTVLDLGCGTGLFLDLFPGLTRPGRSYTGVDISMGMLARAREKHPYASFSCQDMLAPQFTQYDLVTCLYAGNYVEQAALALHVWKTLQFNGHFFGVFLTSRRIQSPAFAHVSQPPCLGVSVDSLQARYSEVLADVRCWPMNCYAEKLRNWPLARHWLPTYLRLEPYAAPYSAANYAIVTGRKV